MSDERLTLLVVDDEPGILTTLSCLLNAEFEVVTASSALAAEDVFATRPVDLILTDQRMPHTSGVRLLEWVRAHSPRTIRLMMTAYAALEEAVDAINRGQVFRYLFKPWRHEELLEVLRAASLSWQLQRQNETLLAETQRLNLELRAVNAELEQRVMERTQALRDAYQELDQKNKMLEKLALTDPLTNLPNRRAMDRLAERELRRRDRFPASLSMGLIDVDHFKSINERFLLPGGDKVLVDLARCLMGSLRTIDFLGRIGGEEFMVVAPETDLTGAVVLGERIRSTVAETTFVYKDELIPVHVSLGFVVAEFGVPADYENLKHVAASALSEAKKTGRDRCVFHHLPAVAVG